MVFRSLGKITNFKKLHDEIFDIIDTVGFINNQIILQSIAGQENWHLGIGSIEDLEEKDEQQYISIHGKVKHTEISKIIETCGGFRTRIMSMDSRRCYSIHKDPTPRIHIPILTNDQCWMIWPYDNVCKQMLYEQIYFTDTTKAHTFVNGGLEPRIHLVMCVSKLPKLSNI